MQRKAREFKIIDTKENYKEIESLERSVNMATLVGPMIAIPFDDLAPILAILLGNTGFKVKKATSKEILECETDAYNAIKYEIDGPENNADSECNAYNSILEKYGKEQLKSWFNFLGPAIASALGEISRLDGRQGCVNFAYSLAGVSAAFVIYEKVIMALKTKVFKDVLKAVREVLKGNEPVFFNKGPLKNIKNRIMGDIIRTLASENKLKENGTAIQKKI